MNAYTDLYDTLSSLVHLITDAEEVILVITAHSLLSLLPVVILPQTQSS